MALILTRTQNALFLARQDVEYLGDSLDAAYARATYDYERIADLESLLDAAYQENWDMRQHLDAIRESLASFIGAEVVPDSWEPLAYSDEIPF